MIRIGIADRQKLVKLDSRKLRRAVRAVLAGEGVSAADLSLAFVDDDCIQTLNEQYLQHAGPTDVITFPLSGPEEPVLTGEIVVSTETARRNAQLFRHSVQAELALYVIHGVLHLCGYDDRRPKDRRAMRQREAHYLAQLNIRLKSPPES